MELLNRDSGSSYGKVQQRKQKEPVNLLSAKAKGEFNLTVNQENIYMNYGSFSNTAYWPNRIQYADYYRGNVKAGTFTSYVSKYHLAQSLWKHLQAILAKLKTHRFVKQLYLP